MKQKKIIIVGAGAAGMIAAIEAAKTGAQVILIEQKEKLGKKLYATGNGKCNYTNTYQDTACYRSSNADFPDQVIQRFPVEDTIRYFHAIGISPKDKNGYIYPKSEQAAAVVENLTLELRRLKVRVLTDTKVLHIRKKNGFQMQTEKGALEADAVIVACGLKASPKLGSDGSLLPEICALGHHMENIVPALVQLKAKQAFFRAVSGIRFDMEVSLYVNDQFTCRDRGEVQLTDYGISGIPTFQISRFAAKALDQKQKVTAALDFFPEDREQALFEELSFRFQSKQKSAAEALLGLLPFKLIPVMLKEAGIEKDKRAVEITKKQIGRLSSLLKQFKIDIIDTNGFANAQVCAGGVDTRELNPDTLESKIVPGLYFAGEVIDVDGICGGYNLQWAWSSGVVAGRSAASTANNK